MNEQDFDKLESLYKKARHLKTKIVNCSPVEHVNCCKDFDDFDPLQELISVATHKKFDIGPKIKEVRNLILLKTACTVNLPDETIIEIIEKSVL